MWSVPRRVSYARFQEQKGISRNIGFMQFFFDLRSITLIEFIMVSVSILNFNQYMCICIFHCEIMISYTISTAYIYHLHMRVQHMCAIYHFICIHREFWTFTPSIRQTAKKYPGPAAVLQSGHYWSLTRCSWWPASMIKTVSRFFVGTSLRFLVMLYVNVYIYYD